MQFEAILKTFALTPQDAQMIPVGAVLFVLFWQAMARGVFVPLLALIERREALTSGATDRIKADLLKEREAVVEYEAKLGEARLAAMRAKLAVVAEAKQGAALALDQAGQKAQALLKSGRSELTAQLAALDRGIDGQVEPLAALVAERVMQPARAAGDR